VALKVGKERNVGEDIIDLIGNTPLVKINRLNLNPNVTIYAKLEGDNPGGVNSGFRQSTFIACSYFFIQSFDFH